MLTTITRILCRFGWHGTATLVKPVMHDAGTWYFRCDRCGGTWGL